MSEHNNRFIIRSLREAKRLLTDFSSDPTSIEAVSEASDLLVETFLRGGRVFCCGNGGSMCDAMHFAEELTGRYRKDRKALAGVAICDVGHLSCVGNDFGYREVFSRYLEAHSSDRDCLVALSTSGSSANVLCAAEAARSMGVKVIGLTGRQDAALAALCTVHICTPACGFADRVQEIHLKVLHILVELIERQIFPENYIKDPP